MLTGLTYNARGAGFLAANRALWKFVVIPLILNLLALGLFAAIALRWQGEIVTWLAGPFGGLDITAPQGFWQHAADAALWVVRIGIKVLLFLVSLLFIVMAVYLASLVLCGPFYELLSERVLILRGLRAEKPFSLGAFLGEFAHSVKTETVKAAFYILVSFLFFLLSWIPVAGIVFATAQFFFSCWFFAWGLSLYPFVMERRPVGEMFRWGRRQATALFGLGLPAMVPVMGILLMNVQVVGGTLLYADRNGTGG